jgi:hypothetical protein
LPEQGLFIFAAQGFLVAQGFFFFSAQGFLAAQGFFFFLYMGFAALDVFALQPPDCCMLVPAEQGLADVAAEAAGTTPRLRMPVAASAAAAFLAEGFFFMGCSSGGRAEETEGVGQTGSVEI